jgi:xeroderma pigmentosum group C-complementing protein
METWHKEGRAPIDGEEPLKRVPYRAATTNRRRELAEAELASGGKVLQGLYSRAQTNWIIPPPIQNGVIPKNSFGNIDLYVDRYVKFGGGFFLFNVSLHMKQWRRSKLIPIKQFLTL